MAIFAIVLGAFSAQPAAASPTTVEVPPAPVSTPALDLSSARVPPGSTVRATGSGFTPGTSVRVFLDSTPGPEATVDALGAVTALVVLVPPTTQPGAHWISVLQADPQLLVQAPLSVGSDWEQYRGGPEKQGRDAHENVLSVSNVARLAPLWTGATDPWPEKGITSSPAVADGVVYVGAIDGYLYAFPVDCATHGGPCAPLWRGNTNVVLRSSPMVDGRLVYVGAGSLVAFRVGCRHDGGECKPVPIGDVPGGWDSSPAIADGVIYATVNDHLTAYRAGCWTGGHTCHRLWWAEVGATQDHSSPAVGDGIVAVGSWDSKVRAFPVDCRSDGRRCYPLWVGNTGSSIDGAPAIAGHVLYTGSNDGYLYAFPTHCATGHAVCQPLWTGHTAGSIASSPAVAGGRVYIADQGGYLSMYAVGCGTGGAVCGPVAQAVPGDVVYSAPAVAGGVVFVASADRLHAYDARCTSTTTMCPELWGASLDTVFSSPAVSDGVVYIGSYDGSVHAFSIDGESPLAVVAAPTLDDLAGS